jgi:hypothetical protein
LSLLLALALAEATAPVAPPPGLQFSFWRMAAFKSRAKQLGCGAGALDGELEDIRKQLAKRYGKDVFAWPKSPPPAGRDGDCYVALMVYRTNLGDFKREAAAALAVAP